MQQWLFLLMALIAFIFLRCILLLLVKSKYKRRGSTVKTMIVLGSGLQLSLLQPVPLPLGLDT
jgi:hypothetical protein